MKQQKIDKSLKNEGESWCESAFNYLSMFLDKHDNEFSIGDFKKWALDNGLPHPKFYQAWGGVTSGAQKRGLIIFVRKDVVHSTARTGHNLGIWRRS